MTTDTPGAGLADEVLRYLTLIADMTPEELDKLIDLSADRGESSLPHESSDPGPPRRSS